MTCTPAGGGAGRGRRGSGPAGWRDLSHVYGYLQVAEVHAEAGRDDDALEWAQRGLVAFADDERRPPHLIAARDDAAERTHRVNDRRGPSRATRGTPP